MSDRDGGPDRAVKAYARLLEDDICVWLHVYSHGEDPPDDVLVRARRIAKVASDRIEAATRSMLAARKRSVEQ